MNGFTTEHGSRRGVVVFGDTTLVSASEVNNFAQTLGWPVLAEPTAVPWLPQTFIAHAPLVVEKILSQNLIDPPDVIVSIGRVGLSRPLASLLTRQSGAKFWVAPPPLVSKLGGFLTLAEMPKIERLTQPSQSMGAIQEGLTNQNSWLSVWQRVSQEIESVIVDELRISHFSGVHVARALTNALAPGDLVHLGSSYPARDVELYANNQPALATRTTSLSAAPTTEPLNVWAKGPLRVFMNRGVNGIDGVISTAIGEALGQGCPSFLFCGDLTFLHDFNGLLLGPSEPRPDLTIVVCDNDGGGIFSTLEHSQTGGFERVMATPLSKDLAAMLRSISIEVQMVSDEATLLTSLTQRPAGLRAIIARVGNREQEGRLRKDIRARVLS